MLGSRLDLRPQLERLDRLICRSEGIDEGALTFAFRPLRQLDEPAKAALALSRAQATQIYAGLGLWPAEVTAQLVADGTYPNAAAVFAGSGAVEAPQTTADAFPVRPGFDPAQPRDPDGRWAVAGGGAGSADPEAPPDEAVSEGARPRPQAPDGSAITPAASRGGRRRGLVPALGALVGGVERFLRERLPEDPEPDETVPPPVKPDASEPTVKPDPRAGQKLDNALSDDQTWQYGIDDQTFQLDRAGMRHILERHAPEYWDGDSKGSQTFFEPGTSFEDIQDVARDVLGQNRDAIIAEPSAYEWKLTGTSGGRNYKVSTYQERVTQVYPSP